MTALELITVARDLGVSLQADGDELLLSGNQLPEEFPEEFVEELIRHKAEVLALLAGDIATSAVTDLKSLSPAIADFHEADEDLTELREACLHLAATCGYPRTPISSAETVMAGKEAWHKFVPRATPKRLRSAKHALESRLQPPA